MDIINGILIGLIVFFSLGAGLSYLNKPNWFIRLFDFPLMSNTVLLIWLSIAYAAMN